MIKPCKGSPIGIVLTKVVLPLILFLFTRLGAAYPDRPIKVIVPTDPGGSVDLVARTIGRTIEENGLLDTKLVIVNQSGAGGTIGTRRIRDSKADGYTIGIWHQGLITSKAMQIVDYDHTAFEVIGSIGYSEVGIGTGPKSRIDGYSSLLEESKPGSIKFATNIGLPVHIVPMIFAEETDVSFQFIQVGGGSQRLSSILGGHTDLGIFSNLDFSSFYEAGIRPVVFFSEKRLEQYPDVPTAMEMGIEFSYHTLYICIAPKGLSQPILRILKSALKQASKDESVIKHLASLGLVTHFQERSEIEPALNDILERSIPLIDKMRNR